MKKRVLIPLLLACLLAALLPAAALAATTANCITYYSWNDSSKQLKENICPLAVIVSRGETTWGAGGTSWYVVNSNVTITSRISVNGTVYLILADGCTLTAEQGIQVANSDKLFIYGQINGTGKLTVTGLSESNNAAIGGNGATASATAQKGGEITIDGGIIDVSSNRGAGIGGGGGEPNSKYTGQEGGSITINGGNVKASSEFGAGMGGGGATASGKGGNGGTIVINGGTVIANSQRGAGIGGGNGPQKNNGGNSGTITINGGTVTANSTDGGAGIGGGYHGNGGTITIKGGTVTATANIEVPNNATRESAGAGIGGGGASSNDLDPDKSKWETGGAGGAITISGGTVTANSTKGAGIGGGSAAKYGASGTFQTTSGGNAVIFASSVQDQSQKASWHGVIFEGNPGEVYGGTVTPMENFTIESEKTLLIPSVSSLVASNVNVTNEGKIYVDGTFTGTADNLYYPLTVKNATAGNNTSDYNSKTYGKAESVIALTPSTPKGQYVSGWDVKPETVQVSNNSFTMPKSEVSIAARFGSISYTVKFNTDGGNTIADKTVYWDNKVLDGVDNPTRSGFTFSGWTCGSASVTEQTKYSELASSDSVKSITLTAQWSRNTYTVSFDTDGGSAVADKTVYWDDAVLGGVANPTKTGWTFTGWTCGNTPVSAQTKYSELALEESETAIMLKAQWSRNTYTVSFDTDGGSTIENKTVYWDDAVLDGVANPTRSGWTFTGWTCGDTHVSAQTKYSELVSSDSVTSITLTAQWSNNAYTVSFDTDGGNAIADKTVYWDDAVLGGVTNPTKTGWTFTGWTCGVTPVTSQTRYSELVSSDSVTSITLTAQWSNNAYTVSFDTDGGSAIADKTVYWDDAVLGGVANPTKTGWTFTGWTCGVTPVTSQTRYGELASSDSVTSITLTAQWTDSTAPVISGIENGKVYCSAPTVTVTDNDGIASVTVNGAPVSPDSNGEFTLSATNSEQTIVVTDADDNRTEMTVTVNDGHRGGTATCVNQAVCIHCGEAYGEVGSTNHVHLGHEPASDATVTRPGNIEYWYCEDCRNYFSDADGKNVITQEDTITPKLPPEIIKGMGQSILAGERKALSFTSNAAFADFVRVEVDGETLSAESYTAKEGSTIVTLNAGYIATLPAGAHTIGIVSESGTAETTFSVNPQLPQTGDNSRMALWMALLLVSGGLLAAVCIRKRSVR